jgi:hypothetical protein
MLGAAFLAAAVMIPQVTYASTFTVNKVADTGAGSLRAAVTSANMTRGPDTINFSAGMSGKTIAPLSPLPDLGRDIAIDGDINNDGVPDVRLNGASAGTGSGLHITGPGCRIQGLAIGGFPDYGIRVTSTEGTVVQTCHLGVNLAGNGLNYNHTGQIRLEDCTASVVGGAGPLRNVIAGGEGIGEAGVHLTAGSENVIAGNNIGVKRDNSGPLGSGDRGVNVSAIPPSASAHNYVGSPGAGLENAFGGLATGLHMTGTQRLVVRNSLFGLTGNGNTLAPISYAEIYVQSACSDNTFGGSTPAARNVFAGETVGIAVQGAGTGNRVLGNWFGSNGAGTARRKLRVGVSLTLSAEAWTIGGATPATGNYFTPNDPAVAPVGIYLVAGADTVVQNNHFGVLPNGSGTTLNGGAVNVQTRIYVRDNEFANCNTGVVNIGAGGDGRVYGNLFRNCVFAVYIYDGTCRLGNLGNSNTTDDGGNEFRLTNTYAIYNNTANGVKAEGNSFGTTLKADIDAKIRDKKDDPTKGLVDYSPLAGGVLPTGGTSPAGLTLAGTTAVPTAGGAEIAFTLSAPAQVSVQVLNVAGRPVASVVQDRAAGAGLNTLLWNGLSGQGLRVPSGAYVIRVAARNAEGSQTTALMTVSLR